MVNVLAIYQNPLTTRSAVLFIKILLYVALACINCLPLKCISVFPGPRVYDIFEYQNGRVLIEL
jgi:hypothetical protein